MSVIDQKLDLQALLVVVIGEVPNEDNAWCCNNVYEADAMRRWLRDNHISAKVISQAEFSRITGI